MSSGSSPTKWVLMAMMLGASGWASFTLYERTTKAEAPAAPTADPALEKLLAGAYQHLSVDELDAARTQLDEAAKLAADDPRIEEGRVLIAVRDAERKWLVHRLDAEGSAGEKRLDDFDHAVHAAREVIAVARREVTDPRTLSSIEIAERRLNTMLVLAFMSAGKIDRAQGVVGARLGNHPQRALIERYVTSGAPAASASASASVSAPEPTAAPPPPVPESWNRGREIFELDHEPPMKNQPKTPNELELPVPEPE